jgi:type I site-specific restriction endonuclease
MTTLWPHQTDGVEFALRHKKVALMHDTGTGKTRTANEIANRTGAKRILDLCPVIAVEHWAEQIEQWSPELSVTIVRAASADLHLHNVLIVPFNLLSNHPRLARRLAQYRFDMVVSRCMSRTSASRTSCCVIGVWPRRR